MEEIKRQKVQTNFPPHHQPMDDDVKKRVLSQTFWAVLTGIRERKEKEMPLTCWATGSKIDSITFVWKTGIVVAVSAVVYSMASVVLA